jgi:hypothetical protein
MPNVFVLPVIRREDHDAFRRDVGPNLTDSYDEWAKLCAGEVADARLQGRNVVLAPINYDEFTRYCHAKGKKPDSQTLLDFAISTKPDGEA